MADIELVIKIPKEYYEQMKNTSFWWSGMKNCVLNGIPLPKGHGKLFDEIEILKFLKCPKYENCDWKNCFDCNKSRCINLNNVNHLVPIIEADKGESEDEKCHIV